MSDQVALFWAKVDRRGPDECWPWTASKHGDGYGQFWWDKRCVRSHRIAMMIAGIEAPAGPPPTSHGWCVLHHCDNPGCVNPRHLFWGSQLDNNKDRAQKDRNGDLRGENHGRAKISNEDVLFIRESLDGANALAAKYGIDRQTIWKIRTGQLWKHI